MAECTWQQGKPPSGGQWLRGWGSEGEAQGGQGGRAGEGIRASVAWGGAVRRGQERTGEEGHDRAATPSL